MNAREKSIELHRQGYNCAQCVLMTLAGHTGLSQETSAALGTGFGGGAGCRELCGALSGAIMATGATLGAENRSQVMAIDREMTEAFQNQFGAVRCGELKALLRPCDELIAFAAEKADALLSD